jgi:uncharacterized protein YhbP (UPF0306 family)
MIGLVCMKMNKFDNLLNSQLYLNLSTVSGAGEPWGTPLFFVFNKIENCFYWWSPKKSQHSTNIKFNPKCFITIFDSSDKEGEGSGIYFATEAEELSSREDINDATKLYNQKAKTFKLSLSDCIGDAPTRIYRARIMGAWTNCDNIDDRGIFYDGRKTLCLK